MSKNLPKNNGTIFDLSSEIFDLIKKIKKQLDQKDRKLANKISRMHGISEITPPQIFVLRLLWLEDGFPLKYLATAAHCSRSTMTGIINTMEKDGLVYREPNPEDNRSTLIRLSEKGNELKFYKPPLNQKPTDFFKDFKPEELKDLSQLLKKLSGTIENMD